jgi:hypothetical protein
MDQRGNTLCIYYMIRWAYLSFLCCTSTWLWTLKHYIITREHMLNSIQIFLLAPVCPALHKSTTTPTCIYPPAVLATFAHIQQSSPHLHTFTHTSTRLGLPAEVHAPTIYSARNHTICAFSSCPNGNSKNDMTHKIVFSGALVGRKDWPENGWGAGLTPKDLLLSSNPSPICLSILLMIGLCMI